MPDLAGLQRRQQVVLHQVAAARQVDQPGALRQPAEQAGIEDAGGVGRQRQQVDQDVRGFHQPVHALGAAQAGDALDRFRRAAPAADGEADAGQRRGAGDAQRAEPEHADAALPGQRLRQLLPLGARLLPRIGRQLAVQQQHTGQGAFHHRLGQRRIDQPGDRDGGRQRRVGEHAVDAGPEALHEAQMGVARQRPVWRVGDQGDVDGLDIMRLGGQYQCLALRQMRQQMRLPVGIVFVVEGTDQEDAHGARTFSRRGLHSGGLHGGGATMRQPPRRGQG